ncbi:MAG: TRAP transporter large permease [Pseudomonadota bacterium]|nr:TRAP transporter large permease [Pseudomonadota bacterium]
MSWILLITVMLGLALIGSRLFVVVGVATAMCFLLFIDADGWDQKLLLLDHIVTKVESLTTKNVFLSIPFFIASGSIMTSGGIARRLTDLAAAAVGWMPGGLAVASVVACIVFAAISGSSPVTLVAVGGVMYPALIKSGYPKAFSIGLITSAGSLGCMIPPAIAMLIYSISVQGVDPADLFFAGIVPALFIAGSLAVYAVWVGLKVPGSRKPFDAGTFWIALKAAGWALTLPLIVLGGIYGGMFTPTEAGAVAFAASLLVTCAIHGDVPWSKVPSILVESATLIGSLILIVVLAFGLNDFLALIRAADLIRDWVETADLNAWQFMLLVNVVLIVLGALMDSISATLVFAPMLAPVAVGHYGMDPIHFGIVFVVNMEIGYIAPPVATNLFVAAAIFRQPFIDVAKAIVPTLCIICAALVVIMYVPSISTGPLNLREGRAFYESFPWDGKEKPAEVVETPVVGTPASTRPLTMQEMMQKAKESAATEGAGDTTVPPGTPPSEPAPLGRPLTMQEMMKKAKENAAAAPTEPAPTEPAPTEPAPTEPAP